tara:strand:+ start:125 stop:325 length:201 start_codon:yes stop_codon:yes gene_type:complete
MLEPKISKEILRTLGILEPSDLDITRFISRFKIDQLGFSKKLGLFVALPALRKFLDIKLDGVIDEK